MYSDSGANESCISLHPGLIRHFSGNLTEYALESSKLQLASCSGSQFLVNALCSTNGWLPWTQQAPHWNYNANRSIRDGNGNHSGSGTFVQHNPSKVKRSRRQPLNLPDTDTINTLPDELLCQIFCFLSNPCDRVACALVSKRWLMLQSHIPRLDFKFQSHHKRVIETAEKKTTGNPSFPSDNESEDVDEGLSSWDLNMHGDLSRSLTGKRASDVRLAAIAVGTEARGGLGKLIIRGGSSPGLDVAVTDVGLSAIGISCTALRVLSLWNCPRITDEGLSVIGKHCSMLEKVDIVKCPLLHDAGLVSITRSSVQLSYISIDHCPSVGDNSLIAIGKNCSNLQDLTIRNCPRVTDAGLAAVLANPRNIRKLRLEGLSIGDNSLRLLGSCDSLKWLILGNLDHVTEDGFKVIAKMQCLKRLHVSSCKNFTDRSIGALVECGSPITHVKIVKCENVRDEGLMLLTQHATAMEVLDLEKCNRITGTGLVSALWRQKCCLRELIVAKCDGIGNVNPCHSPFLNHIPSLQTIILSNCAGVGDLCLAMLAWLAPEVTKLELTNLNDITDEGLMAFLSCTGCKLKSVKFAECPKLTDRVVCAMVHLCGGSLRSLIIDGCKMVSDKSLKAMATRCSVLEDLDLSECGISNEGLAVLLSKAGGLLLSLNLSGCQLITDRILPLMKRRCDNLTDLNLKNCAGLTESAIVDFESRMWKCSVFY